MPSVRTREPSSSFFRWLARAGACFLACAALVSVGCSGDDETFFDENEGGDDGAGASGGTRGGRGGTDQGGDSSGGDVSGGGSGLAGSGGNAPCNLADLESCETADDLCCPGPSGGECVPASLQNCGACHAMCNPTTADACVDRACRCGSEPPCSGDAPFCHEGHCAECRNDADCAESSGGDQCVNGACSACDPADDSGCSGATPICSPELECEPCSAESPCESPLFCQEDSGRCVGCVESSDCPSPTTPICGSNGECSACASEAECFERDPEQGECLGSGECSACDPNTDAGCGAEECVPDGDDGYHCAECGTHLDCDDPEKPLCDAETQTCVPCNHENIELPDAGCTEHSGGSPVVCITTGDKEGECGTCDPGTNAGCTAENPFCDSDLHCKGCLDDGDCPSGICHEYGAELDDFKECWGCESVSDCPSGKVCSPSNACVNCANDDDCVGNPAGSECVLDSCRQCDPNGNAGCSGEKDTCHNGTFVCVECMNGSQCGPGQGCSNFQCTECSSDGQCAGNASGAQCVQVTPGDFECKPCDPLDNSGCAPTAVCTAGFVCAD